MVKIPNIVKNESLMNDSEHSGVMEVAPQAPNSTNPQDRASGPSSTDLSPRPPRVPAEEFLQRLQYSNPAPPAPPQVRALPPPPPQHRTGMERAAGVLRVAIPFVQRLLPLLDGHVGTAVSNVLAPHHPPAPPQPLPPPVNIVPLQEGLADLRVQQRALRDQVLEQNASLKRVEDHLQAVREATDRNTLEQQELLEDLKSVGSKVNFFAYVAIALLFLSVIMNVVLFLQFRHIIP